MADGAVSAATLATITAAAKIGPVTALVATKGAKDAAAKLAAVNGVADVLAVDGEQYANGLPEEVAPVVSKVAQEGSYTHVLAGASAFGKGVIPRAAVKLDAMAIADIVGVESEDTFKRFTYAGNAVNVVTSKDAVKFITVRGTAFDRAAAEGGSGAVKDGEALPAVGKSKWVEDQLSKSDRPDLATAANVVCGGRGLKNKEGFEKLMFPLADKCKAAIGATRAVVDAGDAPADLQVGQTGKVIAPNLYMGFGVSGAIQHLAGMKDSKTIVVVNTDADAPFFQVADYGLVGDAFKVVPELIEKL
uniref:Electron transfer flavoprotein subunit alpha n=1 Tax=Neobodo designis TaxID=312471 RepID=A0A7S1Q298_NEODS